MLSVLQYSAEDLCASNSALHHCSDGEPAGVAPFIPPPEVKNAPVVPAIFDQAAVVGLTPKLPVIAGSAPSYRIYGAQLLHDGKSRLAVISATLKLFEKFGRLNVDLISRGKYDIIVM